MDQNTFSFIIPIYNAKYKLKRCIESVVRELWPKDEIILIDDGSTDGSSLICDEYKQLYSNIIVIHQTNSGVSVSRNKGIMVASKKWIVFLDADDYLKKGFRKAFNDYTVNFESDCYIFSHIENDFENQKPIISKQYNNTDLIKNVFYPKKIYEDQIYINYRSVWAKIYKRTMLVEKKILFPVDVFMAEDCFFNLLVYSSIKNAIVVNDAYYHYYFENEGSVTSRYKPTLINNKIKLDEYMEKWFISNEKYRAFYENFCLDFLILHIRDDFFHKENIRKIKENKKYINKIIVDGKYDECYINSCQNGLIKEYPFGKRIAFWAIGKRRYFLLKLIHFLKYSKN